MQAARISLGLLTVGLILLVGWLLLERDADTAGTQVQGRVDTLDRRAEAPMRGTAGLSAAEDAAGAVAALAGRADAAPEPDARAAPGWSLELQAQAASSVPGEALRNAYVVGQSKSEPSPVEGLDILLTIHVVRGGVRTPASANGGPAEVMLSKDGRGQLDISFLAAWSRLNRRGVSLEITTSLKGEWVGGARMQNFLPIPLDPGTPPKTLKWDIGVLTGPVLVGRCVDPAGRPMKGVHVVVRRPTDDELREDGRAQGCTDADGRFVIAQPANGTYHVRASNEIPGWDVEVKNVRLDRTQDVDLGSLRFVDKDALLTDGRVLFAGGQPVGGALVTLRHVSLARGSWFPPDRPAGCEAIHPSDTYAARTADDGGFRLPSPLFSGRDETSVDVAPGWGVVINHRLRKESLGASTTDIEIWGHRRRIRIVDRNGFPLYGPVRFKVTGGPLDPNAIEAAPPITTLVEAGPDGVLDLWGAPGSELRIEPLDEAAERVTIIQLPKTVGTSTSTLTLLRVRD